MLFIFVSLMTSLGFVVGCSVLRSHYTSRAERGLCVELGGNIYKFTKFTD